MRHTIWTLTLMITVGLLGFAAGWNAQPSTGTQVVSLAQTAEPQVVLAKTGGRQKEALKQNEGCQVMPNEPKANEQDSSIMKGLVF